MIPIADRMVDLNGQGQEPLAVPLEKLSHGENREQKCAFVEHIDVEGSEFQPWNHRYVERVGRCAVLRRIAGGLGILLCDIFFSIAYCVLILQIL